MIPHHQVAIDVSEHHIRKTCNPALSSLMRELIWTQRHEVAMMQAALDRPFESVADPRAPLTRQLRTTVVGSQPPNQRGLSDTHCDPHFFDPQAHAQHVASDMTDLEYIDHMIPHHQVAVDMSKRLLEHTSSDHLIALAYRIIRSQEGEIRLLNDMRTRANAPYWGDGCWRRTL